MHNRVVQEVQQYWMKRERVKRGQNNVSRWKFSLLNTRVPEGMEGYEREWFIVPISHEVEAEVTRNDEDLMMVGALNALLNEAQINHRPKAREMAGVIQTDSGRIVAISFEPYNSPAELAGG